MNVETKEEVIGVIILLIITLTVGIILGYNVATDRYQRELIKQDVMLRDSDGHIVWRKDYVICTNGVD